MLNKNRLIHCEKAAKTWLDGFPTGNGILASMMWGDERDIISLNHEFLWRGVTRNRDNNPVPKDVLQQIRDLIENREFFKATALSNVWLGGTGGMSGIPGRIDSFQPAGELCFSLEKESEFIYRQLDLTNGIATSKRKNDTCEITTTNYCDSIKNYVICHWSGTEAFDGIITYERMEDEKAQIDTIYKDGEILYTCSFEGGISFKTRVKIQSDGEIVCGKTGIRVKNATNILAIIDIVVCLDGDKDFPEIQNYSLEEDVSAHTVSFSEKMNRFSLNIETKEVSLPLERRLESVKEGAKDDGLMLLFYNFGRYLFLSSNLNASLPANLQGKWNRQINAEWGSDYHFNINLQMNYWLAEPLGMGEYAETLVNLIERFIPHGKKAAKDLYNCRGIWMPHAGDMWGRSTPESYGYGVWISAAGWLAQHFWKRYIYSGNKDFLKKRAYPFFKEVAEFYEDYTVKDDEGVYQLCPSQSPENAFLGGGRFYVTNCKSSAMDVQIAYDSLGYAISAAEILGIDNEKVLLWENIRKNLPDFKIGKDGRLLEWNEEFTEKEPFHRHVSHLYGLYPSDLFTEEERPLQFQAAKESLDFRVSHDGGRTGWSRAWIASLYARLGQGEEMYENVCKIVSEFTTKSLLDVIPLPFKDQPFIFQIDANLGAVAAITEGIAQYKNDKLYLLPAIPKHWKNGEIKGLHLPGGHCVNFKWQENIPTEISVRMGYKESLTLIFADKERTIAGKEGEIISITEEKK